MTEVFSFLSIFKVKKGITLERSNQCTIDIVNLSKFDIEIHPAVDQFLIGKGSFVGDFKIRETSSQDNICTVHIDDIAEARISDIRTSDAIVLA